MSSYFRFLPSFALVVTASAQLIPPPADEPVALENIVVTASPYARSQADLAQPTSVLAGRQLTLRQAPTLGDLLAGEPGVSSTGFAPGASRPIIRGLGGDRIRILDNGLGTIDASIVSPDHTVSVDPLLIERVEVVRGPASLLYGGAAVGGVVNVITHRIHSGLPDAPVQGRVEARFSSVNEEETSGLVLEGAAGQVAWHLDLFRRRTGDIDIPGYTESARYRAREAMEDEDHDDHDDDHDDHDDHEDEEAFGTLANTAIRSYGAAFGLSFIDDRGYLGLAYSGFNSLYGVPAGAHAHHGHEEHDEDHGEEEHDEHEDEADENVRIDLVQRRLDLEGEWRAETGLLQAVKFNFGSADYRHTELEGDEIGTVFTNRGYDGRFQFLHEALGAFTGALGAQAAHSDFNAVGAEAFVPPSETTQLALFFFEEATFEPATWQFGARVETQDIDVTDGSGRGRSDDTLSLSTGLVWELGPDWNLGASLSRTQRAPNAQELYADGPHLGTNAYEIGDATLGRETSLGLDVTLRKRTGHVTGSVTGFVNDFDGFIYEIPTGEEEDELPVYQFVQRDARFYGGEVEAIWHLHNGAGHTFDLTLGADYVRATDRTVGGALPRIPPLRLRTGLDWQRGPFTAGAEVQWVDAQTRITAEELPTDSYALVSAYAGYRWPWDVFTWDLFVRGTNLTDEEARLHTSFLKDITPLPGRNVTVGLRLSF